jgi:gp16 family phage-associated protein
MRTYARIHAGVAAKTLQEVQAHFEANGVKVSDWARENGFRREHVYAVLSGRARGRWGEAHAVAVALGLKRGAIERTETQPIPAPVEETS